MVAALLDVVRDQRRRLQRSRDGLAARLLVATDHQTRDDLQALVTQADIDVGDIDVHILVLEKIRGDRR